MFKLAGILLLMAGCAGLGFERVAEEKRRINELREMRRMIVRMQDEMLYGKRTLQEICLLFGQCMKEPYRSAFAGLYEKLEENDGRDLTMLGRADGPVYEGYGYQRRREGYFKGAAKAYGNAA